MSARADGVARHRTTVELGMPGIRSTGAVLDGPPTAPPGVGQLRGTESFPKAAKHELANAQLRRNLGHATSSIRAKRAAVVAEVPDWEALRDAASAIKTEAMANLPELLTQLEQNYTAAGGHVHWARDAQEANSIVVGLVRDAGAKEVVKIKSMVSMEIGLNEALEADGVDALETDQIGRAHV